MMRHTARRVVPRRETWHALQEFTLKEADQVAFREVRARDGHITGVVQDASRDVADVDWKHWESTIQHKEIVSSLKDFHTEQMKLLKAVAGEDHSSAVVAQQEGWELYEDAIKSCVKSVETSENIVKNGCRALYISFNNPPLSQASVNEWIDSDQYWQAFVEKHQFYHNHMCSSTEDPESLEYDAKIKAETMKRWEVFDGRGDTRFNNKLMASRPTYEYYDLYRGPLVEHMIYYLTKTGGDARFFPELMPFKWFTELYATREKVFNVLQRRRAAIQTKTGARSVPLEMMPADLEHDGEAVTMKTIQRENAMTEVCAARLMGNYIFLNEPFVPIQTTTALQRAIAEDNGAGKFYSLGEDVNCLFYLPSDQVLPSPQDSYNTFLDHLTMTGRRLPVAYNAFQSAFVELLETRKAGLQGSWFNVPGESQADAFLRRLNKYDPARPVYEAYVAELKERLAQKIEIPTDKVLETVRRIQDSYIQECAYYDSVLYSAVDEVSSASKAELEKLSQLKADGGLQMLIDNGGMVAISGDARLISAEQVDAGLAAFDAIKDKNVEMLMATKTPLDGRK